MLHLHKWHIVTQNDRWKLEQCKTCGFMRWDENYLASYQPKPKIVEKQFTGVDKLKGGTIVGVCDTASFVTIYIQTVTVLYGLDIENGKISVIEIS